MPSFVHDADHKNFEYREPHDRLQDGLAALRRGQFDRPVLGVDLGSHASRVGVVVGGRVELCGGVLPSRVARVDGAWVVGAAADAAADADAANSAMSARIGLSVWSL